MHNDLSLDAMHLMPGLRQQQQQQQQQQHRRNSTLISEIHRSEIV